MNAQRRHSTPAPAAGTADQRSPGPAFVPEDMAGLIRALEIARANEQALLARNAGLENELAARTARLQNAVDVLRRTEARLTENLQKSAAESAARIKFFAAANHELRAPLNGIVGFTDMLKREMFGKLGHPKYREYVGHISDAASHLLGLANDLLDLSSAEAGNMRLDIRPIDAGATIQSAVGMLQGQAEKAGVALKIEIDPDLPVIHTDALRLRQIVLNLASNAIKFTPSGGSVTIRATCENRSDLLVLVISDTGAGMTPDEIVRALQPFSGVGPRLRDRRRPLRSSDTDGLSADSSGLGLPITQRLAEVLGGDLTLESQPGVGTIVTVKLPLTQG